VARTPDETLNAALLAELGGVGTAPPTTPPAPVAPAPDPRPVVVTRSGTLAPGAQRSIPFRLAGPGRRVTVTASVSSPRRGRAGARIEIVCENAIVQRLHIWRRARTLDMARVGPATCAASLISTSTSRQRYSVRLRLSVET
jgi:hypothetical protein